MRFDLRKLQKSFWMVVSATFLLTFACGKGSSLDPESDEAKKNLHTRDTAFFRIQDSVTRAVLKNISLTTNSSSSSKIHSSSSATSSSRQNSSSSVEESSSAAVFQWNNCTAEVREFSATGNSNSLGEGDACIVIRDFSPTGWLGSSMDNRAIELNNKPAELGDSLIPWTDGNYYIWISAGDNPWANIAWY